MSVLFKALSKAAKTREAAAGAAAPIGQPVILNRGGSRSSRIRLFALVGALCVGAAAGSYLFFLGDDTPAPARTAPRPRPPIIQAPVQQQQAGAPASSPAESNSTSPAAAPVVAAVASSEQPKAQPSLPPSPPAPAQEPAKTSPAEPLIAASAGQKANVPIMPVEEDLPTVLARLRRQKAGTGPVSIARSGGSRDLLDEDGHSAIQVGVAPQAVQLAARAAYDDLMQGRYEEALRNYDKALAGEPRNPALLVGKATALQKLGRIVEARTAYGAVLSIDPANREALTNMTMLLASQAPEKALTDLHALRQANPGFSPIEAAIGTQQANLGDVPAAIDSLNHAVSLSPDNGLYRLNLAILQDRAGLAAEAAASYRSALGLLAGGATGLPLPADQIRRRLAYLEGR